MSEQTVVVYKTLPPELKEELSSRFRVLDFSMRDGLPNDPEFQQAVSQAQGLLGSSVPLDADLLSQARQLKVISSISAGVDKYDLDYLRQHSITLCHTPDALTETVADTALLLLLATARRGMELHNKVQQGRWQDGIPPALYGRDVHHKRLGIVGMGRIGAAIARRASLGFSMQVCYHNRSGHSPIDQELPTSWQPLDKLLANSDFICSTLPLTADTQQLFGAREFQLMGPNSFFVNIGRGGVVDESALITALQNQVIKAAGLDVFATEPLPGDSPLLGLNNVVTLPHIGSATVEARHAMARMAVENLIAVLEGGQPHAAFID